MPNGMSQRIVMIDTPQLVGVFTSGKNQEPEGKVFHIQEVVPNVIRFRKVLGQYLGQPSPEQFFSVHLKAFFCNFR